jgi:AAA family ATP:ADP antiporter
VQMEVVRAMGEIRSPQFLPKLLEFLPNRHLRSVIRGTLLSIGSQALDQLEEALANPWMSMRIRRQLPRAIAQFDPQTATDILVRRLYPESDGGIRYRILRALILLRERSPGIRIDPEVLDKEIDRALQGYFRSLAWQRDLQAGTRRYPERATEIQEMILELLDHKRAQTVDRLFRLISLRYPGEDARRLARGLRSQDPSIKAGSLELVDHLLGSPLREAVLATVDDISPGEALEQAGTYHSSPSISYEKVLTELLGRPGVGLRTLVIYHIGELGLDSLRPTIERMPSDLAGLVTTAVNQALVLLKEAESGD